jgi:hypothetical protein
MALAARQDLHLAALTGQRSRFAAIAARHDLRDEVCLAMADGRMTGAERYQIMSDAKRILKPEEYVGFQRAVDRMTRPQSGAAKHSSNEAASAKKASAMLWADSPMTEELPASPIIPTGVVLPDHPVAPVIGAW